MAKEKKKLTPESAKSYVHMGVHSNGGWREAIGGIVHRSLPAIVNSTRSITVTSAIGVLSRVLIVIVTALFPLLIRKVGAGATGTASGGVQPMPQTFLEGLHLLGKTVADASVVDYILGFVALGLVSAPRLFDLFKRSEMEHHSPFYKLTAAVRKLPLQSKLSNGNTQDSIRLTLSALRKEMEILIGDNSNRRVTDVVLLEFCDASCRRMQVRERTANHEETKRPVDSEKLVAYYVAQVGRNFVEHDFKNDRNPFPPKRVTVRGDLDVDYRSVLYMPIMVSAREQREGGKKIVDHCIGVICVHSSKPYRFWRWGDHKKTEGRFADIAFSRSMPYIAIIEQLLSRAATPRLCLEAST